MKNRNNKLGPKHLPGEKFLVDESRAEVVKQMIAFQIEMELKKQQLTKSQLAKRMNTSRAAVDRLLDPKRICTLKSLVLAAIALGKHLEIKFTQIL